MGITRNRRNQEGFGRGHDAVASDREFCERFPSLADFLHLAAWPDGDRRETGTMLVFVEDGLWKACLNDRDGDCYAFLSAESFEGLLSSADGGLGGNSVEWRYRANKGRKR